MRVEGQQESHSIRGLDGHLRVTDSLADRHQYESVLMRVTDLAVCLTMAPICLNLVEQKHD